MENKEKLVMELAPQIEKMVEERLESRITHRVVMAIIEKLEEDFYPPEDMIKPEFIKSVEEAEKRIKSGKSIVFKNKGDLESWLNKIRDE
jgi:hypothetical protein